MGRSSVLLLCRIFFYQIGLINPITNRHAADVTKLFQNLVSKGALVQVGQGRWTRYSVLKKSYSAHLGSDSAHLARKKMSAEKMEEIILSLCRGCWLTRKQLGKLLGRNPDGLRFLSQMVGNNLLSLKYPDKPNHADQAYTAAEAF